MWKNGTPSSPLLKVQQTCQSRSQTNLCCSPLGNSQSSMWSAACTCCPVSCVHFFFWPPQIWSWVLSVPRLMVTRTLLWYWKPNPLSQPFSLLRLAVRLNKNGGSFWNQTSRLRRWKNIVCSVVLARLGSPSVRPPLTLQVVGRSTKFGALTCA